MDPITQQATIAAAGAGGGDPVYVDDVFSTYLYTGNEGSNQINNGIDLAGEGGLVWFKNRTRSGDAPTLIDTETQSGGYLISSGTAALSGTQPFSSFNSNGYTINAGSFYVNDSSHNYVSWAFRKAPGFFDCVTYTGNGTAGKTVAHSLGSVPGMIMVKCTSTGGTNWLVYHRSLGATKAAILDLTNAAVGPSSNYWNNTAPTSTEFTLGASNDVNSNGATYVAYIFAHDDASFGTGGNESIIKCGSFTSGSHTESLGFEPQFLLAKRTDNTSDWFLVDSMRGFYPQGTDSANLRPNTTNDENAAWFHLTADGFYYSSSANPYIYMAIRRPHKPPTAGTEVFMPSHNQIDINLATTPSNFAVDAVLTLATTQFNNHFMARLTGQKILRTNQTATEISTSVDNWDYMDNVKGPSQAAQRTIYNMFKRAPGFMDVVAYSGNNVATNQNHNLGVPPELIITKARSGPYNRDWHVGPFVTGYSAGYLNLNNSNAGAGSVSTYFPGTPTSAIYGLPGGGNSGANGTGYTYISYLFATLSGISKVGTYTGTGNAINVDCGFSSGARFILIKRFDASGDWYAWNSSSGIVSGNDPYVLVNDAAPEVTNTDYIDPLSSGFTVTSSAPTGLNASGGTYIFLAIA
jgi:hypothetical protein